MTRIKLSKEVIGILQSAYWNMLASSSSTFNAGLSSYYQSLGWDIEFDHEHGVYSIPENQATFFLLSL